MNKTTNLKLPTLSEENLFDQIHDEMMQTLFYSDTGTPLRSLVIIPAPCSKQVTSTHALVQFPGVGTFLLSLKKVG